MPAKYDSIGVGYNVTRKADPYITAQLLAHLQPRSEGIYLDIGCGTGNYTNEFQKRGVQFIGIDPSKEMLEQAQRNNKNVDWRLGTAESIALSDQTVSGIIASLTLHHWQDLHKAFSELHRVVKSDGRIVIFTATPKQMKGYWLNYYFPKMLAASIAQMPTLEKVKIAMISGGIEFVGTDTYSIQPDLQDHFLYCGKHNPELYFNAQIRRGISSFSSIANSAEIETGLLQLRADIDSGKIDEIITSYKNDLGDYCYVIGKKPASNDL
ncbi:MAG: class I SAM-dependent methyltransferase [Bacteroidota bacterium]